MQSVLPLHYQHRRKQSSCSVLVYAFAFIGLLSIVSGSAVLCFTSITFCFDTQRPYAHTKLIRPTRPQPTLDSNWPNSFVCSVSDRDLIKANGDLQLALETQNSRLQDLDKMLVAKNEQVVNDCGGFEPVTPVSMPVSSMNILTQVWQLTAEVESLKTRMAAMVSLSHSLRCQCFCL